jgi:hypothetical protein
MLALSIFLHPALAADDGALTRMALCKDSWADWKKSDPAKMKAFLQRIDAQFAHHGNDPFGLPKTNVSVMGFRVVRGFPDSAGMALGFSLGVDATFDNARKAVEKALGKPFGRCQTGGGMRMCGLKIAPQRTVTLAGADKANAHETRIGCFYFYPTADRAREK